MAEDYDEILISIVQSFYLFVKIVVCVFYSGILRGPYFICIYYFLILI